MRFLWISFVVIAIQTGSLEVEVATIKPAAGTGGVRAACHGIDSKFPPEDPGARVPLGRCVITSGRLAHIVSFAYSVDPVEGLCRPNRPDPNPLSRAVAGGAAGSR